MFTKMFMGFMRDWAVHTPGNFRRGSIACSPDRNRNRKDFQLRYTAFFSSKASTQIKGVQGFEPGPVLSTFLCFAFVVVPRYICT